MRIIIILIVNSRYAVLDAKSPMQRVFPWGLGLGVCAASLVSSSTETLASPYYSLALGAMLLACCAVDRLGQLDDKLEEVINVLLEEEDEGMYHPPYDIELPEDKD
jgi:hypothetical protein